MEKGKARAPKREPFAFGGVSIAAGSRQTVDLPLSVLSNHTPVPLSVHVIHGAKPGPTVFISAAVHGDEIQGVEIVRRLMNMPALKRLAGTLLLIPIVNAFGFVNHSRYLPDRRDLNRSFPGSEKGSLAAQLANLFFTDIVERCDYGIDLHSAAVNRTNLPQMRVSESSPEALRLARVFGAPVILQSALREGSMRQVAEEAGVPVIVYEAGEALRFDEFSIRVGVKGVLRVLKELGMIVGGAMSGKTNATSLSKSSTWVRAPEAGLFRAFRTTGESVAVGETIGVISDPFGDVDIEINAPRAGLIIGRTNLPVVNQGDALIHVASVTSLERTMGHIETLEEDLGGDPLFDEDEIL